MTITMREKIVEAQRRSGSCVCVGLDPDPSKMPIDDVFEFNRAIIDATHDLVAAYKPQFAFYEALGLPGLEALEKTIGYIRDFAPGAFVLADAKRGDIGSTAEAYARAMFETWDVDACTVYAYQGSDSVTPFLEYPGKGVFVVCRTSNPSSIEVQDVVDEPSGETVFERVARQTIGLSDGGNVGLVVGATYPQELASLRAVHQDTPFLIPGVGAQGGDATESARLGGENILISSSRGIIYASQSNSDFDAAARRAVEDLRAEIAAGR
ncbi:MAG: orotidine-5'-phosphate decarboxylase [Chloroflexi bacterium]|nr:orotidine-5'-phosphate decarboxylase [Chloroflexota bacterium]